MINDKRITVFVGNYGSGKTEISLDFAFKAAQNHPTTLVDLDIVNPYFRSGEKANELRASGIEVLMPNFANTAVDVPSVPAAIQKVFDQREYSDRVIFDVGGDDTGAAALGRYYPYFTKEMDQVQVFFVLNTLRPLSSNVEDILDLLARIEARARLRVNGIIHNTNLADQTQIEQITAGHKIAYKVSTLTKIPLAATVVTKGIYPFLPPELKGGTWVIERRMKPDWME